MFFAAKGINGVEEKEVFDENKAEMVGMSFGSENPGRVFRGKFHVSLDDASISWSLNYLFSKASDEVKQFHSSDFIKKIAINKNGILVSRRRILDVQRFQAAGGLEESNLVGELGIKSNTPDVGRFSLIAYSIGEYVHRCHAKHAGYKNCDKESLINICIINLQVIETFESADGNVYGITLLAGEIGVPSSIPVDQDSEAEITVMNTAKLIDKFEAEETTEVENEVSSAQFTLKPIGEGLKYKVVTAKSKTDGEVALCNMKSKLSGSLTETIVAYKSCCCFTHCAVADIHAKNVVVELDVPSIGKNPLSQFPKFGDRSWLSFEENEEEIFLSHLVETDEFISMLTATGTDFGYLTDGEGGDSSPY